MDFYVNKLDYIKNEFGKVLFLVNFIQKMEKDIESDREF